MGVDYYTCANESCGYNFPDCGDFYTCSSCENWFCSEECGGCEYILDKDGNRKDSDFGDASTCILCRNEVVTDYAMVHFLLKKLNLTREEAVVMYRKETEDNDDGK